MKNLKKNFVYSLCYQVLIIIAPLITTPYISRVLGADNIGIYSYSESILTYFKMFASLGLGTFGQRELSYYRDDINKRTNIFWETKFLEFLTSTIVIVVYIIFSAYQKNSAVFFMLIFGLLAGMVDITWFFYGMEEVGKTVGRNFVFKLIGIAYIFIFVKDTNGLLLYAFGNMFFMFLGNASLWLFMPKYIKLPNFKNIHPMRNIKTSTALFLPTIASQIFMSLDKTMLGAIADNSFENGYYEQATKVVRLTFTIINAFSVVMIPRIGYYFSNNKKDLMEEYTYKSYKFVWMISIPLCLGLIGVANNLVPWFFGASYEPVVGLLYILSFLIIFLGLNTISGVQYLVPTKRENVYTGIILASVLSNVVLNAFLIGRFYSAGAAVASVAAEGIGTLLYFYYLRKELKIGKIISSSVKYWISGIVMFVIISIISNYLKANIINTAILVVVGMIVYLIALLLLHDSLVYELLRYVKGKINGVIKRG